MVDSFDLSWLVVDSDNPNSITPMGVLPQLEDFELYETLESDDTVLKFITSRMDPFSHIAVLKRVKVVFDRAQEPNGIDIQEQIEVISRNAGISLELNLEYLPPSPIPGYDSPFFPLSKPIKPRNIHPFAYRPWEFWADE